MLKTFLSSHRSKIKLMLLVLLSINILIYALTDSLFSTIDALAWVALLLMFEFEANIGLQSLSDSTLHSIRNGLIAVIAIVFLYYINTSKWLDVINSILWFMLIALLELEIRYPKAVMAQQQLYWLASIAVFVGLVALVFAWLSQAAWLDAYDAALWIAAFALIEVDIFRFLQLKKV